MSRVRIRVSVSVSVRSRVRFSFSGANLSRKALGGELLPERRPFVPWTVRTLDRSYHRPFVP